LVYCSLERRSAVLAGFSVDSAGESSCWRLASIIEGKASVDVSLGPRYGWDISHNDFSFVVDSSVISTVIGSCPNWDPSVVALSVFVTGSVADDVGLLLFRWWNPLTVDVDEILEWVAEFKESWDVKDDKELRESDK